MDVGRRLVPLLDSGDPWRCRGCVAKPFTSHRVLPVLAGLAAVGFSASCGGSFNDDSGDAGKADAKPSSSGGGSVSEIGASGAETGASSDPSAAECQKTSLRISASGTVSTPDRSPFNPTLAASPSGDAFLGVWIDVPVPGAIWASVLGPPSGGVSSSRATQVAGLSSCNPVAAWTGNGFAVAWGNGTNLMLQQLDSSGAIVGPSMQVASRSNTACPDSLVAAGGGLVLEWTEGPRVQEGGAGQWLEYAALIGSSGLAESPVLLNSLGAGGASSLAVLAGAPYAAYTQVQPPDNSSIVFVSEVQWSSPLVATSLGQGNLFAFFPAGPQHLATLVSAGSAINVYETGGSGVVSAVQADDNLFAASADACGRIVGLATDGQNVGTGGAVGPVLAETVGGHPPSQVTVTTDFEEIALLGAGSTFGVLWVEGAGGIGPSLGPMMLRFATLSWQ